MNNKQVTTKIRVRYDTWDNWKVASTEGKGALYVPLAGEICAVKIDKTPAGDTGASASVPEAMFKIGDGAHTFQDLEWASAKAADVYSWAKGQKAPYEITNFPSTLTGDGTYLSDVTNSTSNSTSGGLSFTKKDNMVTTDSEQMLVAKKTFSVQDEQEKTEKDMIVLRVDSDDTQQTPTADLMKLGMSVSDISDSGESYGYATLHSEDTGSCSDLTISSDQFTYTGVNRGGNGPYKYKFPLNTLGTTTSSTAAVKTLLTDEDILSGSIAANNTSSKLVRSLQVVNYVNDKLEGKSVAYVINTTGSYADNVKNGTFNVKVDNTQPQVTIGQNVAYKITTINNEDVILESLHVGDVIYTKDADVKDWFYAGLYTTGGVTNYLFCQIAADKPVLSNYVTITDEQTITGVKTFSNDTKWVSDVKSTTSTVAIDASDGAISASTVKAVSVLPSGSSPSVVGGTDSAFLSMTAANFYGGNFIARNANALADTANQTKYQRDSITRTVKSTDYKLTLPAATGTLALTSAVPTTLIITNEATSNVETDLGWGGKKVTLTSVNSADMASTDYIKLYANTTEKTIAAVSIGVGNKVLTQDDTLVLYGGTATDVI